MRYLFLMLFIPVVSISQQTTKINKILKVVHFNDSIGIMKGKEWLIKPGNYNWDDIDVGILVVTPNEHVGLISYQGEWILDTIYSDIYGLEGTKGYTVRNSENEYAYYSEKGKMLIPYALQEFQAEKRYIISLQGDFQTLYDLNGNIVVPKDVQTFDLNMTSSNTIVIYKANGKQQIYMDLNDVLPPTLAHVDGKFAVAKNEATIYDYFVFLAGIQNNPNTLYNYKEGQALDYRNFLPDTNRIEAKFKPIWRAMIKALADSITEPKLLTAYKELNIFVDVYTSFSFNSEQLKMAQFPVTGVNLEQAKAFANWMSLCYAEYYESTTGYAFQFSIPTEEEWQSVAQLGLNPTMQKKGIMDSINEKGCFLFNYSNLPSCKSTPGYLKKSLGGGSVPVNSFFPSGIGVYNIFGNVAEMTLTEGVAKGGSFSHAAAKASISLTQQYSGPESWLGIRLIAVPIYW